MFLAVLSCAHHTIRAGWPEPQIHDEYSYLFAAKTFALGRITNPPHDLRSHFETFGIIQSPTCMSKYPPLPGVVLAIGMALGSPIYGAWLSFALMVVAVAWMLRQWRMPRLAVVAGTYLALHPALIAEWANRYYAVGGSLAFAAASLVYGSISRLQEKPNGRSGILLGLGLVMLMVTRPYEGLIAALPALTMVAWRLWRIRGRMWIQAGRAIVGGGAIVLLGVVFMPYYNYRITGNALRLPYALHHETYYQTPLFVFQDVDSRPKLNSSKEIREFDQLAQMPLYEQARTWPTLFWVHLERFVHYGRFYLGISGSVFLVFLWFYVKDARKSLIAVAMAISALGICLSTFALPHYAAPLIPGLLLLMLIAARRTNMETATVTLFALMLLEQYGMNPSKNDETKRGRREAFIEKFLNDKQEHLVLIEYSEGHDTRDEWVYNEPDIDGARVVWARKLDDDERILARFRERRIWRVRVGRDEIRINSRDA